MSDGVVMTVSVQIVDAPQRWLAAATFHCAPDEFPTTVSDALGRIGTALIDAGLAPADTYIVAYERSDAGYDGAVGYEVDGEFASQDGIVAFSLPPGEVGVVTFAEGDTDEPLAELEIGVLAEGRELSETMRLWEEHRPSETAIFWPLAPAT